jgi:chorismate synthase
MASNQFGDLLVLTTFGESHGPAMGGVIDGFPAGFRPDFKAIQSMVDLRRPGRNSWVTPRRELDQIEWLSGLLEGLTTGAPIAFLIRNQDARPEAYQSLNSLWRPGHAQWAYHAKYGVVDSSGGGRSSARETVVRVVAGALAQQWLQTRGVRIGAHLAQVGEIRAPDIAWTDLRDEQGRQAEALWQRVTDDSIFCSDPDTSVCIQEYLQGLLTSGDSIGAIVEGWVVGAPAGWGDPIARKLDADLAAMCLSLPACKGFEVGEGFDVARLRGSQHNDPFACDAQGCISPSSNHAGGLLGGITTGLPILFRAAFKPTSSIRKEQTTCTREGVPCTMRTGPEGRHDPCVGVRAVPIVAACTAWVVANAALRDRLARSERT